MSPKARRAHGSFVDELARFRVGGVSLCMFWHFGGHGHTQREGELSLFRGLGDRGH